MQDRSAKSVVFSLDGGVTKLVTELLSSLLVLLHCLDIPLALMAHSPPPPLLPHSCMVFRRLQEPTGPIRLLSHPKIYWETGAAVKPA